MRWSHLKTEFERFLAPSVAGRVGLHSTRYRRAHDQDGRAWITLDGREIINMSTVEAWSMQYQMARRMMREFDGSLVAYRVGWDDAGTVMEEESIFWQSELGGAMYKHLSASIEDILVSDSPVARGLGMLDRRLGKRRLRVLLAYVHHPLVETLLEFRREAEGIARPPSNGVAF